jgi:hypothetical protein
MVERRADKIERSLKQICVLAKEFDFNGGTRKEGEKEML